VLSSFGIEVRQAMNQLVLITNDQRGPAGRGRH